jgi:aminotransferase
MIELKTAQRTRELSGDGSESGAADNPESWWASDTHLSSMVANNVRFLPNNVFSVMDARVDAAKARGIDVIDLSKANPDLPTPEFIVEAGQQALERIENHRYSQFDGKPALLQAAQEWYRREQGVELDWNSQLLATCGAGVALTALTQTVLEPGDVLAVVDPYYPPYAALAQAAGAELLAIPCTREQGFLPDFETVSDEQWSRTKLLLLNYPNNPTGAVASEQLFRQAIDLAHRHGFLLANDFAYASLGETPSGSTARGPAGLLSYAGSQDVAVEAVSLSKMYGMAGWRLGFIAGPSWLMRYIREYHHQMCSSPTGAVQDAGAAALLSDQSSVEGLSARYAKRRGILSKGLEGAGIEVFHADGALFVWAKAPHGMRGADFAELLLDDARVAVMPGDCFGAAGEDFVRFSLLDDELRLEECVRRIRALEL